MTLSGKVETIATISKYAGRTGFERNGYVRTSMTVRIGPFGEHRAFKTRPHCTFPESAAFVERVEEEGEEQD